MTDERHTPPPRCLACGYDNTGLAEHAVCPECGVDHYWAIGGPLDRAPASSLSKLVRAHRLVLGALGALVLSVGAVLVWLWLLDSLLRAIDPSSPGGDGEVMTLMTLTGWASTLSTVAATVLLAMGAHLITSAEGARRPTDHLRWLMTRASVLAVSSAIVHGVLEIFAVHFVFDHRIARLAALALFGVTTGAVLIMWAWRSAELARRRADHRLGRRLSRSALIGVLVYALAGASSEFMVSYGRFERVSLLVAGCAHLAMLAMIVWFGAHVLAQSRALARLARTRTRT